MLTACSRAFPDHAQIDHLFGHKTRKETEVELLLHFWNVRQKSTESNKEWKYSVINTQLWLNICCHFHICPVSVQQAHNGHNRYACTLRMMWYVWETCVTPPESCPASHHPSILHYKRKTRIDQKDPWGAAPSDDIIRYCWPHSRGNLAVRLDVFICQIYHG